MAIIKIKRGGGLPSGLTFGELAFDVTNQRLYFGITGSAILVNSAPTSVVTSFNGLTGSVTGVSTFNGLTGNVTGVTTGTTNTFGPLQSFTTGINTAGFTFTGTNMNMSNGVVLRGAGFGTIPQPATITLNGADLDFSDTSTISFAAANINFNNNPAINFGSGTISGNNIVNSVGAQGGSGLTGAVSIGVGSLGGVSVSSTGKILQINNTGVRAFNGATGIVSGVGSAAAGTGISVSGATGAVTITNTGVQSLSAGSFINLSGTTGTVTANNAGVWTFNGATGTVSGVGSVAAGTAISVSGSTGSVTIGNQGVLSFNGLTGAVSGVTTSVANTFTALQTFSVGISGAGATFGGQVNAQNLRLLTIGGDEGGQLDFGLPTTNTSLTGGVAIDIYQNKMRFFETGGSARGYYLDLTAASNGVGSAIGISPPGATGATGPAGANGTNGTDGTSPQDFLLFNLGII